MTTLITAWYNADKGKIESYGGNGNENEKSYAGGNRYREISWVL